MAGRQRDCRCSIFWILKLNGMDNKVSVLARTFKSIVQKSNTNCHLAWSINLNGLRVHLWAIGTIRDFNLAYRLAVNKDAHLAGLGTQLVVLNAETTVLQQRKLATDLQARRLDAQMALIKALGGVLNLKDESSKNF